MHQTSLQAWAACRVQAVWQPGLGYHEQAVTAWQSVRTCSSRRCPNPPAAAHVPPPRRRTLTSTAPRCCRPSPPHLQLLLRTIMTSGCPKTMAAAKSVTRSGAHCRCSSGRAALGTAMSRGCLSLRPSRLAPALMVLSCCALHSRLLQQCGGRAAGAPCNCGLLQLQPIAANCSLARVQMAARGQGVGARRWPAAAWGSP